MSSQVAKEGIVRPGALLAHVLVLLVAGVTSGCGTYVAHRIAEAPNRYPSWLAPKARVFLEFDERWLTNFPAQFVEVGPPPARLLYRVVSPGDYQLQVSSTNRMKHGKKRFQFTFHANLPGKTNSWTVTPRGTAVLLHGYGLAEFAMVPWALRLAEDGWRCVLVDLRGHGKSTGRMIYYGIRESGDLSQLLNALARRGQLASPVAAVGESYGASLALRWKTSEPRVGPVVAIAPYAVLSNAVLNICRDYAPCLPRALPRAGMKQLPAVLGVQASQLDPVTVLARHPVRVLFVGASGDKVTSASDMERLCEAAAEGSKLVTIPDTTHETVTYCFDKLTPPVLNWLDAGAGNR